MKTLAVFVTTVLGMALSGMLSGCGEAKGDDAAVQNALRPSKYVTDAVEGRFTGAHIYKYAEIKDASGWRTYVAAFNIGNIRRTARIVPGRGLVAWQKFVTASQLPARVHDSVLTKDAGASIRSAGELWLRDEKGAEQLAGYRILCRRSGITTTIWRLLPDGSLMPADPRWVDIDSLVSADLQ